MKLRNILPVAIAPLLLSPALLEAVVTAPTWQGDPGTTEQTWWFTDSSLTPAPDASINPYGQASAEVIVTVPFGTGWQDPALEPLVQSGVNLDGAWDVGTSGSITVSVEVAPGGLGPGEFYRVDFFVYAVVYAGITAPPEFMVPGVVVEDLVTDTDLLLLDSPGRWDETMWAGSFDGVTDATVQFRLQAPSSNISVIDEYTIYTRYELIPEPAATGLFGVGVASLVLYRRRRELKPMKPAP